MQRPHRRDNDAQLGVAKARVFFHQRERAQVQTGAQRDAVNARVQRRVEAHFQRVAWRIHRQLFHHVDEHHAVAALGFHRLADMQLGRFGQLAEVKLNAALVRVGDVAFVKPGLALDEFGVKAPVRHVVNQRVGDVADAAQTGRFEGQLGGGNVHAHAANDEGNQFFFAKFQAEIINALHRESLGVK